MRKSLIVILAMAIFLLPKNVLAEKIVFATTQVPPFVYMENGNWVGIDVDIIREICKRHGLEAEFKDLPWKRGLNDVEKGNVDGMFPLFRTEERTKFMYFPSEYIDTVKTIILIQKGSDVKISNLNDLKEKKVATVAGFSYGPIFDAYTELKKEECNEMETQAKMLNKGRVAAAVVPDLPFGFISKQLGFHDKFETAYIISEDHNYVGFSMKLPGEKGKLLAEKFEQSLRQLRQEGVEEKILAKYR